jgi:nitrile hydratase accessory protein
LSGHEHAAAPAGASPIPHDVEGPVFPAPWAARAFAVAVTLNERGVFAWDEWSEALGAAIARAGDSGGADPEAYWRAWLAALEEMLMRKEIALDADLLALRDAWRSAAEATPHGRPIELRPG